MAESVPGRWADRDRDFGMLTDRSLNYGKAVGHAGSNQVAATGVVKDGTRQIFVLEVDDLSLPSDEQVTSVAVDHGDNDALYISGLSWNPDGNRIYFQRKAHGSDPADLTPATGPPLMRGFDSFPSS